VARVVQTGEYFVVGGPVQPDRPCYIERESDKALRQGIDDRQFCYVLSPKASGKSSLMARTIRTLRAEGQLAAVVDLTQIGARGEGAEAGRWYYSIAYRILRELRLKVDLQSWWQEKSALMSEQRLGEFFWEIVLANTTAPVTIFFDEAERAVGLPFAKALFGGIRSCYSGRITEPDFSRLNFVVLGVATPRQLCPDITISPFEEGRAIELEDFTLEETFQLAPGLGGEAESAQAVLERIYEWAGGQPYLTQKMARGVARRGGAAEEADRIVREQFLGQGTVREEPLLNHIRALLMQRSTGNRQALVQLGRIGRGARLYYDSGSTPQQILRLAGVITARADGEITFRNKLFEGAFTTRWVSSAVPFNWRGSAVAAAVVATLIAVPLWYTRYFPRPYIQTLSAVTQDFEVAMDAYDKLHRFPGFAGTADRLLAGVMTRRSREAETFAEAQSTDATLRRLPGYSELADELMGEYWMRRARQAVHSERRDEALLLSTIALTGQDERARELAAELIGNDYRSLLRSFRLTEPPARWEVDWESEELTLVDQTHLVRRLRLSESGSLEFNDRLTALQHVPVTREISVDEPGSAAAFQLRLVVDHPTPQELMITLQAPSGAGASFTLEPGASGTQQIVASGRSPLAALADEDRQGIWRLTLVDRGVGSSGQLTRWGLYFAEELRGWEDQPQGLAIPDPVRTDQIDLTVSVDGRLAIARSSRDSAVGAVALWDLRTGTSAGDVQLDADPEFLALTGDTSRVLAVGDNTLSLWDAETGAAVARVATQTGFLLPPAITEGGAHVAIAEQLDAQDALYSLLRTDDGELVSSVAGLTGVTRWLLGPEARYLALVGPSRLVRIMDPYSGAVLTELPHERDPVRLLPATDGDLLLSIDDTGDILAWDLGAIGDSGESAESIRLGHTVDAGSVSIAADGSRVAYEALQGEVVARDLTGRAAPFGLRIDQRGSPIRTRLAPDGNRLLTSSGDLFQLWRLDDSGSAAGLEIELSAIALDEEGGVAALGFRDGHVGVTRESHAQIPVTDDLAVDFIGHQGGISSLAVNVPRDAIVSGGSDGLVRVWELATGAPTAPFMRHPEGPIHSVTMSEDGRWIGSAAEYSARVWQAADGELVGEIPVSGRALSVSFSAESDVLAVGDDAGNIFLATPESSVPLKSIRARDAVTALAFGRDGDLLASGDAAGNVQLWDPVVPEPDGEPYEFPHPVRWLGFSDNGQVLVVQTNHWLHRLALAPGGLVVVGSRLLEAGMEPGAALLTPGGDKVRLVGGRGTGQPRFYELDLLRSNVPPIPPESVLLSRDWSRILGLRLDGSGEVVQIAR